MNIKKIFLFSILLTILASTACSNSKNPMNPSITPYPTSEPYELMEGTATEFTVSSCFSDDMVIQRDQEIVVYGTAPESQNGKVAEASFKGIYGSGIVDNGRL